MNPTADQLLLQQIRGGDASAWEQCIARFEGRLLAFVRKRLGDQALAEDVVQETFVGFLTSLPNFDPSQSLEAFLFSIATYKLTDVLRRKGRRPALSLTAAQSSGGAVELAGPSRKASSLYRSREESVVRGEKLRRCLARLIEDWLQARSYERLKCVELLFVLGWPNKRVAATLGISEQAVANHKFFVISKLKESGADGVASE